MLKGHSMMGSKCKKNEITLNLNSSTDIVLKYKRAKEDKTTLRNRQIHPGGYF